MWLNKWKKCHAFNYSSELRAKRCRAKNERRKKTPDNVKLINTPRIIRGKMAEKQCNRLSNRLIDKQYSHPIEIIVFFLPCCWFVCSAASSKPHTCRPHFTRQELRAKQHIAKNVLEQNGTTVARQTTKKQRRNSQPRIQCTRAYMKHNCSPKSDYYPRAHTQNTLAIPFRKCAKVHSIHQQHRSQFSSKRFENL